MYTETEERQMEEIAFAFEDCPVGVDPHDSYMGKLNREWVFARRRDRKEDKNVKITFLYDIYRIPEEYHTILESYWHE